MATKLSEEYMSDKGESVLNHYNLIFESRLSKTEAMVLEVKKDIRDMGSRQQLSSWLQEVLGAHCSGWAM